MTTSALVFVGIKGSVVALSRATGEQVWATHLKGSDFVNVVLDNDVLLASCYGEIFSLNPLTGSPVWHNALKGYGLGLATIATSNVPGGGNAAAIANQKEAQDAAARSAGNNA